MDIKKNQLHEEPEIYTVDNIITDEECEHFIQIAKPFFKRAGVCADDGSTQISSGRTNSLCWFPHDHDDITKRVCERISKIVGISLSFAEKIQVIYYDTNQRYNQHWDGWKHDRSEASFQYMKNKGQRLATALCYLNTVDKGGNTTYGGSTTFTKLNIHVPAEKGKLLVFHNVYKDTNRLHPDTQHAGTPVIKGEKYAFNLWFREVPRGQTLKEYDEKKYLEIVPTSMK